jgi:AcrR family transcriptional regulator
VARTKSSEELRVDAARNRERILVAARAAFAECGLDVPFDEIARRAEVGIATLYRRFPTRGALLAAAFAPKMSAYAAAAGAALEHHDPWEGFSDFIRKACAMQAADAGFADVLTLTFPTTAEFDRELQTTLERLREVVDRAQTAGVLRADFVLEDLVLLLMANAGVVNATKRHAPRAWQRFAAYMLDAFRAPGHSQLPKPPSPTRISKAIRGATTADRRPAGRDV